MIERLKENLKQIQQRMAAAAGKSGRSPEEVKLIGVTKYVDIDVTRCLFEAGCTNLGESRPQVLWDKAAQLSAVPISWHMIGHLQRNKVKRTIVCAELIHSLDSIRLIDAIDEATESPVRVLLEVNVSGESAKHGFRPPEIEAALRHIVTKSNVRVEGFMCMAGLSSHPDDERRAFESLREILEHYRNFETNNISLRELSMGMSADFEIAIEEGSTMVRVGSALFAGLE